MDEIAKTQQRTRSYWFSDGIAEMVGGLAMALVGLPMIAAAKTGLEVFSTAALFGMILLFPLSARVVRYLKNRITHPRTGYVKYPRPSMSKRRRALLAAVLVAVSIVIILSLTRGNDMLEGAFGTFVLVGMGAAMTAAFAVRAVRMRMPRMLVNAVACGGGAAASVLAGIDFIEGVGWLLSVLGATSVITGAYALFVYLGRHPSESVGKP